MPAPEKNFAFKLIYFLQNEFDTQKLTEKDRDRVTKAITVLELVVKKYKKPQEYRGIKNVE